jgi:hypothetical protein
MSLFLGISTPILTDISRAAISRLWLALRTAVTAIIRSDDDVTAAGEGIDIRDIALGRTVLFGWDVAMIESERLETSSEWC